MFYSYTFCNKNEQSHSWFRLFSSQNKKINTLFISNLMGKDVYFVRYTHMNAVLHEIIIRKISTFLEKKKNKHLI